MTEIIYDNGSIGSKLLQYERKDAQVVKGSSITLVESFTKFDPKNGKIFLPFTVEELAANNEDLRKQIQQVEAMGFKNLIVLPYEGDNTKEIENRAKVAKIGEVLKGEVKDEESKRPYTTVRTDDRKVSAL